MSRQDATDLLLAEREGGVFLVRDSTTITGDYVLCVRFNDLLSVLISVLSLPISLWTGKDALIETDFFTGRTAK